MAVLIMLFVAAPLLFVLRGIFCARWSGSMPLTWGATIPWTSWTLFEEIISKNTLILLLPGGALYI